MITIWFLVALMSYPGIPTIAYKGFGGYLEKDECEEKRVIAENHLSTFEMERGNTVYVKTFCLEMDAFDNSFKVPKESGEIGAKLQLQEINYDGYIQEAVNA